MAKFKPHLIKNLLREVADVKRSTNTITKNEKLKRWLWAIGGSAAVATELWENHQRAVESEMLRAFLFNRLQKENYNRKGDE